EETSSCNFKWILQLQRRHYPNDSGNAIEMELSRSGKNDDGGRLLARPLVGRRMTTQKNPRPEWPGAKGRLVAKIALSRANGLTALRRRGRRLRWWCSPSCRRFGSSSSCRSPF